MTMPFVSKELGRWWYGSRVDRETPHEDTAISLRFDSGDVNIQRWWNYGINLAVIHQAAVHVAICNDDITLPPGLLAKMSARLDETGATICYPCGSGMMGWCFMLNLAHGIRPDERFRWYYGDTDLHEQALRLHGVCDVDVAVPHHHPGERESEFADLIAADEQAFRAKWNGR